MCIKFRSVSDQNGPPISVAELDTFRRFCQLYEGPSRFRTGSHSEQANREAATGVLCGQPTSWLTLQREMSDNSNTKDGC